MEAILADFRGWLLEAAEPPSTPAENGSLPAPVDLHTLLAQFTALRHEVNLQTKAVRAQQEQNTATLGQLTAALERLNQPPEAETSSATDDVVRPMLKTLIEMHDALSIAGRELKRMQGMVAAPPETAPIKSLSPTPTTTGPSLLGRMFGAGQALQAQQEVISRLQSELAAQADRARQEREAVAKVRQLLGSLATGYTMSLQRVERALQQHELEALDCVGADFDPEMMEVVEVVPGTDRPKGEVIEEVLRGYLWRDRLFRFAQVRVAG